ncbi:hypothetical protein PFAG_03098 [Plasmodium falciparum Santa Lucia]|uniref:Uncharacterized protein n=3 Tax=Plasmodium falciparum TaxID=5833 RepID=A0A024V685_PLAFA|nr:hypothetical protein PFFVO_03103 [Plasmodium falciparum Vietnam Oak-Knoll (FVO)]EUR70949.1 hypothetical protein PFBG_03178 [Plasmodium falciparum 7G8]EUT84804.1 hypothetical protein PFAG_03098 [Plasmodium falciparum Santa Lucia]
MYKCIFIQKVTTKIIIFTKINYKDIFYLFQYIINQHVYLTITIIKLKTFNK